MKKFVGFVIAGLILGAPYLAYAKTHSKESAAPAASAPLATDAKRAEIKKKIEEKKKELNGSEWKVDLTSGGKREDEDVLTFQNGQVKSKYFSDKGFPASNYTLSIPEGEDGLATWETMQTHPKGNVIFMRGEWKEKTMRGVVSEQLEEGKTKDHNFNSTAVEAVAPSTEKPAEVQEAVVAPVAAEAAAPVTEPVKTEGTTLASGPVAPFNPGTTEEIKPEVKPLVKPKAKSNFK